MAVDNIKDQLANDPRKTPYVWEARTLDRVIIAVESPEGGVDDTPFAAIGFMYRARTAVVPDDVHTFVNESERSVIITARSLRESVLPHIDLQIDPGDALVWCHRAVMPFQIMGHQQVDPFETMVYGRELTSGKIEICQVWPNGEYKPFDSYQAAMTAL